MRSILTFAASLIVSLGLAACSGIETEPAATDTFAAGNYHYYRWRSQPMVNSKKSADPIYTLDPILRKELDTSLAEKGYILDQKRAQFSVDYIFAEGLLMGERSRSGSNLSTHPGAVINRNTDQAEADNAYALGGVKETRNLGIQFNDIASNKEVWRVVITKIIDDANATDTSKMDKQVIKAVKNATKTLPAAS